MSNNLNHNDDNMIKTEMSNNPNESVVDTMMNFDSEMNINLERDELMKWSKGFSIKFALLLYLKHMSTTSLIFLKPLKKVKHCPKNSPFFFHLLSSLTHSNHLE